MEPIGEDDGVPSRERNFTEELQQIDEEMEQVGEALSKDKELKKIEEDDESNETCLSFFVLCESSSSSSV